MNRTEIIKEFTDKMPAFKKMAFNIAGEQDCEDLFQACTLMLLEFTEERLIAYYNPTQGLKPFFIRMLCNQYRSKTSHFHRQYRKQDIDLHKKGEDVLLNMPQSVREYQPEYFEQINKACKNLYNEAGGTLAADLEKTIWELYAETGSLRKTLTAVQDEHDFLSLKDIHTIVKKFQRTIKEKLKHVQ